jgi:RNA polymerase sigma factor (sigma-70 family)
MDGSLRARLRAGHASAFAELFDEHADVIYRYAVRSCGNWAVAEDVVSATFLEAWRRRGTLNPGEDPVRPWLFGIATNVLRNTARGSRRHLAALARIPAAAVEPDFTGAVAEQLDDAAQLAVTRRAMAGLGRKDREVIELCVWAGLDYAEAAGALGVPVGTVKSRLSRARVRLRELVITPAEPHTAHGQIQGEAAAAVHVGQEGTR